MFFNLLEIGPISVDNGIPLSAHSVYQAINEWIRMSSYMYTWQKAATSLF